MIKKKLIMVFMLVATVVVTGILFFNGAIAVKASNVEDIKVEFCYDGKSQVYSLFNSAKQLSKEQRTKRQIDATVADKVALLYDIKQLGLSNEIATNYVLYNIQTTIKKVDSDIFVECADAQAYLDANSLTFNFVKEKIGRRIDYDDLYAQIYEGLICGKKNIKVNVSIVTKQPRYCIAQLKANTTLKGHFVTEFVESNTARVTNIKLAASQYNGVTLMPSQQLSFNKLVGERTEKRGYKNSKIIVNGQYVEGIGGGVCQVSTTVYTASLLADLEIVKQRQHTLLGSYFKPSMDAMVNSGSSDLIIANNTNYPIYFATQVKGNRLAVYVFGSPNAYTVKLRSQITKVVKSPINYVVDIEGKFADKVTYADEEYVLIHGNDRVESSGFIQYYKGDKLICEKLLRKNVYMSTPTTIIKGSLNRTIEDMQ